MYVMCIRDIKADAWHNPMFVRSIGATIRSFADEINKTDNNPFALHPEDYELYEIGTWDELTGRFTQFELPKSHGVGSSLKITR